MFSILWDRARVPVLMIIWDRNMGVGVDVHVYCITNGL